MRRKILCLQIDHYGKINFPEELIDYLERVERPFLNRGDIKLEEDGIKHDKDSEMHFSVIKIPQKIIKVYNRNGGKGLLLLNLIGDKFNRNYIILIPFLASSSFLGEVRYSIFIKRCICEYGGVVSCFNANRQLYIPEELRKHIKINLPGEVFVVRGYAKKGIFAKAGDREWLEIWGPGIFKR
jgi:hypothetical protein